MIKSDEIKEDLDLPNEGMYNETPTNQDPNYKIDTDPDKLKSKYVNGFIKIQDTNGIVFNSQVIR